MAVTGCPTLLAVLLERKGLNRYGSFCAAYEKAARSLDGKPAAPPSRAQFHRWLTGDVRSLPYTDHCRVLEHILAGFTASQLFAPCAEGVVPAPGRPSPLAASVTPQPALAGGGAGLAGVEAVFASRSEFTAAVQPAALLDGARLIRAAGLSLNLICQSLAEHQLRQLVLRGAELCCLFLDPAGASMQAREQEEDYAPGALVSLTRLNIDTMARLRDRLPEEARGRVRLATYDETIRFNLILVDDETCVAQPYMPAARGIESPTFVIRRTGDAGLYPVFDQVFTALTARSSPI
jgi:hypothetical protein